MITLTEKAVEKLNYIAESESVENRMLRLGVKGGGCAGFHYDMFFEENGPTEFDEQFVQDGITIVVDPMSLQYLDGTDIDYVDGVMSSGFKFNNPNVSGGCGCGKSFAV